MQRLQHRALVAAGVGDKLARLFWTEYPRRPWKSIDHWKLFGRRPTPSRPNLKILESCSCNLVHSDTALLLRFHTFEMSWNSVQSPTNVQQNYWVVSKQNDFFNAWNYEYLKENSTNILTNVSTFMSSNRYKLNISKHGISKNVIDVKWIVVFVCKKSAPT